MDWALAIERNREALKGILATIFLMLEQAGGAALTRISRPLHRAVLSVLRPAESAARRLIVIVARDLAVKPSPVRPMPKAAFTRGVRRRLAFPLFDPRPRLSVRRVAAASRAIPRIHAFGADPRVAALWPSPATPSSASSPAHDGRIAAGRLVLRLEALKRALEDLPRQARRLVRLQARRTEALGAPLRAPLRPGRPPGFRRTPLHDVDRVLAECHDLACRRELDTS